MIKGVFYIRWRLLFVSITGLIMGINPSLVLSEVMGFDVIETVSPAYEGRNFGDTGTYSKIIARATIAVDPSDPANAGIVDIDKATRNSAGKVEATMDVVILRPSDPKKGNGTIFYDVVNRGNKLGILNMNDIASVSAANAAAVANDAGNGFLLEQGYTVVWSGWQFDVKGDNLLSIDPPVLNGVSGQTMEEYVFDKDEPRYEGTLTYPVNDGKEEKAQLFVRNHVSDTPKTLDSNQFQFTDKRHISITRPDGANAGAIYTLVYEARDPVVAGLGFAATRDLVSFLRNKSTPAKGDHPLNGMKIDYAYGHGISQSGRYLRDFLYQGFNTDEAGRQVFDAILPFVAGSRKTYTNYRFAQPGRYSRQHEDHAFPGDQFPFTYATTKDPISGRTDGIMQHCSSNDTCPKVIQVDTDTEVRQARLSLLNTAGDGSDIALPENVRAYYLVGMPHFSPSEVAGSQTACQELFNPLSTNPFARAILVRLDQWVKAGTKPPDSQFPSIARDTWVAPEKGIVTNLPDFADKGIYNDLEVMSYHQIPPVAGEDYQVFLPKADTDGFSVDGVRLPPIAVPKASYFGWNLRKVGYADGDLCGLFGSTIPFESTADAAKALKDSRQSLAERYASHADYVAAVRTASDALVAKGLLLPADAKAYVAQAENDTMAGLPSFP